MCIHECLEVTFPVGEILDFIKEERTGKSI